jgi:hypothetical protein
MQVVGSYPGQDLAGCITATIWPPESALPAFRMNLQGQQLIDCTCELVTEHGSGFSDFPVINRLLPLKSGRKPAYEPLEEQKKERLRIAAVA